LGAFLIPTAYMMTSMFLVGTSTSRQATGLTQAQLQTSGGSQGGLMTYPSEKETTMPMVDVDLDKLTSLYEKAVEDNEDVFMYEGQEILTTYAKYLIEFLKVQI